VNSEEPADCDLIVKINTLLYVRDLAEWHTWLEQHASDQSEAWIVFYKGHTGQPCISYDDALDEALCFGWIDSLIQKLDESRYARKFTPRKNIAKWSEVNKRRVARLVRDGRMTAAGLAKLEEITTDPDMPVAKRPLDIPIPAKIEQAIRNASPAAWENFLSMAPSYRRTYILWLSDAKRPETFEKRITEAVRLLEQNQTLGMK
jgi:uncharacterized protein YdeI (YjbR/CyaY-like superfamily)